MNRFEIAELIIKQCGYEALLDEIINVLSEDEAREVLEQVAKNFDIDL